MLGQQGVEVQGRCYPVRPGWYQMTACQQQPRGSSRWWTRSVHVFPYGGSVDSQVPLDCPKGHPLVAGLSSAENHSGSERLLHGQTAMPVITHSVGTAEVIARTGCAAYSCPPLEIHGGEPVVVPLACGA